MQNVITLKSSTIHDLNALSKPAILALLQLSMRADSEGHADVSCKELADWIAHSRLTAWRAVEELERAGFIVMRWVDGKALARVELATSHTTIV